MRYFGFLARFVIVPLLIFRLIIWRERHQGVNPPEQFRSWPEDAVLIGHVAVAVAYTTPWDNYLVASNVWSYDPDLVIGATIGYVPIEEYSFFVLQSLLTGSLTQLLARRVTFDDKPYSSGVGQRALATGILGAIWLGSITTLVKGNENYRYLSLILGWALPPIMLQTGFGGDILWRHRLLIAASVLPATLYLGLSDSLAIGSGTWNINPDKTVKFDVIRHLPFEELLFFFLTNVLLVFGVTLVQDKESERRLPAIIQPSYYKLKHKILAGHSTPG